jgi:2-polyprenyl-6-methoxyphenol hydroxylase-like FAD-dependent oxidoreductase
MSDTEKKIVVVGGGPAGAAVAMGLAQQGHSVALYEAYPHPLLKKTTSSSTSTRKNAAYVIVLNARGQTALKRAAGISADQVTGGILSRVSIRHPSPKYIHRPNPALLVPRQELAACVAEKAKECGVKVFWEHRLVAIDFDARLATFATSNEQSNPVTSVVPYDLLIGADGVKSQVRNLLDSAKLNDFSVTRLEADTMEYQVVVFDENPFAEAPATAVHVWNDLKFNSICFAFPLANKQFLMAPVFPDKTYAAFQSDPTLMSDAVRALFSDVDANVQTQIIQQLQQGKPVNGGTCVWCSSLGSPSAGVALVGDAGHGMWASLGQGANCALESAAVFVETVKSIGCNDTDNKDWSRHVVQAFNDNRHADAVAAVDLSFGGIGNRSARGYGNSPLFFKLQVMTMLGLCKLSFGLVPKPALMRLMTGDPVHYRTAKAWHLYYEKYITMGVLAAMFGVPAYLLSKRQK